MAMAKQLLAQSVAVDGRWKELVRRLPATGIMPLTEEMIAELLAD
jgi:hypothetical protein